MNHRIKFGLAGMLFFLAGCATKMPYEVKGLTPEKLAYLKADSEHAHEIFAGLDEKLYIHEINGDIAGNSNKGYPEEAKILEGNNEVKVRYWHMMSYSNGCVKFNAEAGNTYIIRKERRDNLVYFWVELEGNEKPISTDCNT